MGNLPIKLRGRLIERDTNGLFRLNDIWAASGRTKNQKPHDWMRLAQTIRLTEMVIKTITGKSRNWTKQEIKSASYTRLGANGGSYADVRLALAYAEYLDPQLALEVKEVFLRYKAADPTLADDILQRASPAANEWAAARAMSRVTRNEFTETLKAHGVSGPGYAICTDEAYKALYDKTAKALRKDRQLPANANLRDSMTKVELASVMLSEALSVERIKDEESQGNLECQRATGRAAGAVRKAIEGDRSSRKKRMF